MSNRALVALWMLAMAGCSAEDPSKPEAQAWTVEDLLDISGDGAGTVWAVGSHGAALRFDGQSWNAVPTGIDTQLDGVSGSAPDDVWAVGSDGIVLHWDGSAFNLMSNDSAYELLGVWNSAPDDVWITGIDSGFAHLRHFDGVGWQSGTLNQAGSLWDVWGNADTKTAWVVGSAHGDLGFLLHLEGGVWDYQGYTGPQLRAVWSSGPSDVFCAAYDGHIEHFDGTAWTESDSGAPHLLGIWGSAGDDVWSVGPEGAIAHFDGSAWSLVDSGTTRNLWAVWGAAPDDVWAVGGNGTLLHWDGVQWSPSLRPG